MGIEFIEKEGKYFLPKENEEWSHILLERNEYAELTRKPSIEEQIASAGKRNNETYPFYAHVEVSNDELEAAKAEILYLRDLNKTLLRINKEKANAARNIRPKKERSGYVILSTKEKEILVNKNPKIMWETVIQSPYNIKFSGTQAKKQIQEELMPYGSEWKIAALGIDKESLYKSQIRANFQKGYWECVLFHRNPTEYADEFYK